MSRTFPVGQTVLSVVLACTAIAFCSGQGRNESLPNPSRAYELYSWEEPKGNWNFCLLPSPSGVNLRAEDIFNKTVLVRGVIALNRRMSILPVGATIFWLDRILAETARKPKESEKLTYPPASIIEQSSPIR
jgi:hypothetical protein